LYIYTMHSRNLLLLILLPIVLLYSSIVCGQESFEVPEKRMINLLDGSYSLLEFDTITSGSQQYYRLYSEFPLWHELGNIGFSALPVKWTGISSLKKPFFVKGFMPYLTKEYQMNHYYANAPFALLNYNSGGTQDLNGQLIKAVFSRPVAPGIRLSAFLDFVTSPGHYVNQNASQSSLTLNLSITKPRYKLIAGIDRMQASLEENGGVSTPGDALGFYVDPGSVSVNLKGAASKLGWTRFRGRQEFNIFEPKTANSIPDSIPILIPDSIPNSIPGSISDSIPDAIRDSILQVSVIQDSITLESVSPDTIQNSSRAKLIHSLDYQLIDRYYKDSQTESGDFYLNNFVNDKEAQDSVNFKYFENRLGLANTGFMGDSIKWIFEGGVQHKLIHWGSNSLSGSIQQMGLYGLGELTNESWQARVRAEVNLLGYGFGNYLLNMTGNYFLPDTPWMLTMDLRSESQKPDLFLQAVSGNHDQWFNNLSSQQEQVIKVKASNNVLKMSGELGMSFISNLIYFDEYALPSQTGTSTFVMSADIAKYFVVGPLRSNNNILFQYTPAEEIPLPLVVASTSTYMHHDIHFKNTGGLLELEYGLDIRYSTAYQGYAYRPSTGAFYLQNEIRLGNYPYLDVFLTLRVKRTRFFIRYEHVNSDLTGGNYFPVVNYPVKKRFLKYGVYWHFYD
jgi:hypothetical protein